MEDQVALMLFVVIKSYRIAILRHAISFPELPYIVVENNHDVDFKLQKCN